MNSDDWEDYTDDEVVWEKIEFQRQPVQRLVRPTSPQMAPSLTPPSSDRFVYSPLDQEARSIRLIRILPEKTADGHIQCELRHALIDDAYICLSYVWGKTNKGRWIALNGQSFWVRQNLFDFLQSAQRKRRLRTQWLWIDALSIDQTTVAERNHQVQQMGQIYSGASEVISWLGIGKEIVKILSIVAKGGFDGESYRHFCNSGYWDRAWITQEVVLARRIIFMAKSAELKGELVPLEMLCQLRIVNLHPQTSRALRGRSLVYLLDKFRLKKCDNARDRVFSLLALCGDGSDVKVDYATLPTELAMHILGACKLSFCLCSIGTVGNVLNLTQEAVDAASESALSPASFAQLNIPSIPEYGEMPLYYSVPCRLPGCDGSDWSHIWNVRSRTSDQTVLSITVDLRYFCHTYRGLITFNINATMEVIDFRHDPLYDFREDSHIIEPKPGDGICTLAVPFYLLFRLSQVHQFGSKICERINNQGGSSAEHNNQQFLQLVPDTVSVLESYIIK
jgi:hypothetical protein